MKFFFKDIEKIEPSKYDKFRVLVDEPEDAYLHKGDIVEYCHTIDPCSYSSYMKEGHIYYQVTGPDRDEWYVDEMHVEKI